MSNNLNPPEPPALPYYIANYKGRAVAIKRDPDYQATIKLIQKSIPRLRKADPENIFITAPFSNYGDAPVYVSEEIWPEVAGSVTIVEITLEDSSDSETNPLDSTKPGTLAFTPQNTKTATTDRQVSLLPKTSQPPRYPTDPSTRFSDPISITLRTTFQTLSTLNKFSASSTVQDVKLLIETEYGIPTALQQLEFSGTQLNDELELGQAGVADRLPVDLILSTRKSLIYVLPAYKTYTQRDRGMIHEYLGPVPLTKIKVQTSANRKWELALVRPRTNGQSADYVQFMSWTVDMATEDTLSDPVSGSKLPWLHWDGSPASLSSLSNAADLRQQSTQLSQTTEFCHSTKALEANNSVVVSIKDVKTYLSDVLSSLLESRKQLLRPLLSRLHSKPCSHVAVRFLSNTEYKEAAIVSLPDHPNARVKHIVLLYKRIDEKTALIWDSVPPFQDDQSPTWQDVIDRDNIIGNQRRTELVVVDFTFLEIP